MGKPMNEPNDRFEARKRDHIDLALRPENDAVNSGFDQVELLHEALPEMNFEEVDIRSRSLGRERATPFVVSSMTAGHHGSLDLNRLLARVSAERGWMMGVGSQRRELHDATAREEWRAIRRETPNAAMLGNIGLSQLIVSSTSEIAALVETLESEAMIVHLNALQECIQPEGTPNFRGGLNAIARLVKELPVPVIVKETGCGLSEPTLARLFETGVAAVDVSGYGGTHWGRIEGLRADPASVNAVAARTFAKWGISTVESLTDAVSLQPKCEIWASGGVRSGLDAAKALAIGATTVGLAKPVLEAALAGEDTLRTRMATIEFELKTALFCTGSRTIDELQRKRVWRWPHDTI